MGSVLATLNWAEINTWIKKRFINTRQNCNDFSFHLWLGDSIHTEPKISIPRAHLLLTKTWNKFSYIRIQCSNLIMHLKSKNMKNKQKQIGLIWKENRWLICLFIYFFYLFIYVVCVGTCNFICLRYTQICFIIFIRSLFIIDTFSD